jgi:hypothetical protein
MDILSLRQNVLSKDELKRCWDEMHNAEVPTRGGASYNGGCATQHIALNCIRIRDREPLVSTKSKNSGRGSRPCKRL